MFGSGRLNPSLAAGVIWIALALATAAPAADESAGVRVSVNLPQRLGTLEFDERSEFGDPALGVAVSYRGHGQTLSIYFYDFGLEGIPDGIDNEVVRRHFETAKGDIARTPAYAQISLQHEEAVRFGGAADGWPALEAAFRIVRQEGQSTRSYLMLTGAHGLFVKIRFTIAEGNELEATANRNAILEGMDRILPGISRARVGGEGA